MHSKEKTQIAEKNKAFKNTDFSDCHALTDKQSAQMKSSRLRVFASLRGEFRGIVRGRTAGTSLCGSW
jgi:hypothetical protein